jgi:redox-sensing transcriptional repressor
VYPISSLSQFCRSNKVLMGIITVPAQHAQDVCDQLVSAGVCGILNFAPVHLSVPEDVLVRNVDIAAQMALLSSSLRELHIKRDS